MPETDAAKTYLSDAQHARVEALGAARRMLVSQAMFASGNADPIDLVSVARYIITGLDPYAIGREDK